MWKIVISILFLSLIGITAFFIILNIILNKIFYLPPVVTDKTPNNFGLQWKERFVPTKHHKKVQVWDINPNEKGAVLVAVHGWANTSESLLAIARSLSHRRRVVLVNVRNHGKSDSEKYMTLIKYAEDVSAVLNFLEQEEHPANAFIVLGHSLGGAVALLLCARDKRVKAAVSISTFADLETMMREGFIKNKLPGGIISSLLTYIEFRIGERLKNISPSETVKQAHGPVLLAHGTKDQVVPFTDMNRIAKSHPGNVQEVVMRGFGHSDLLDEAELAKEIDLFLQKVETNNDKL